MAKRRTEITIETERVLIVNRHRRISKTRCPACDSGVEMIAARDAAPLLDVNLQAIYQRAESEAINLNFTSECLCNRDSIGE
jgi:hypothetical protein